MIWREIQKLSFVKQGAVNGFLLGTLIQLFFIREIFYEIKYYLYPEPQCIGFGCPNMAKMINYSELFFLSLTLSLIIALSCLVVCKFLRSRTKSQFFLWTLVGFFSTVFLYIYSSIRNFINEYLRECWWVTYESCKNVDFVSHLQMDWIKLAQLLIIFGIFLAFNLLFVFVVSRRKALLP